MPRKQLPYRPDIPYHVVARSNNHNWFNMPLAEVWRLCSEKLRLVHEEFELRIHAFVLMSNHYHMLCSTSAQYPLGFVMNRLQTELSQALNLLSGRVNHVFGGRYRGSLINNPVYYSHVYRYIGQNPVRAKMCRRVEDYRYSSLGTETSPTDPVPILSPDRHFCQMIEKMDPPAYTDWLNCLYRRDARQDIRRALQRSEFRFYARAKSRRKSPLESSIFEF